MTSKMEFGFEVQLSLAGSSKVFGGEVGVSSLPLQVLLGKVNCDVAGLLFMVVDRRRTAGRGSEEVHPSRTSPRSFCALPVGEVTTLHLLAVPKAQPDDVGASFHASSELNGREGSSREVVAVSAAGVRWDEVGAGVGEGVDGGSGTRGGGGGRETDMSSIYTCRDLTFQKWVLWVRIHTGKFF